MGEIFKNMDNLIKDFDKKVHPTRIPITPIRLPIHLKEEAKQIADTLGVSLSELLKTALVDYMARFKN